MMALDPGLPYYMSFAPDMAIPGSPGAILKHKYSATPKPDVPMNFTCMLAHDPRYEAYSFGSR